LLGVPQRVGVFGAADRAVVDDPVGQGEQWGTLGSGDIGWVESPVDGQHTEPGGSTSLPTPSARTSVSSCG